MMDPLVFSPSPEPQNPITDPANTSADHQPEVFKDVMMVPSSLEKRKLKAKKKEMLDEACSSSSSSSTSSPSSTPRVLRNPSTVPFGMARRSDGERQAEALALGISFAAFANLVVERKNATGRSMNVDALALIYACAIKESLDNLDNLEKSKLKRGVLKAALRAERLKTELEDIRKADMFKIIMDWFVLSAFSVLVSMRYGAYVFSHPIQPSSLWVQDKVSSINAMFNVSMILLITVVVVERPSIKRSMPISYPILFLSIYCGFVGKFCVDRSGGNGQLWFFLWAMFCLLQLVAKFFSPAICGLLFGPINVTQGTKSSTMVPYWARRVLFFGVITLVLPLINGLLPFATFGEWRQHFSLAMSEFLGELRQQFSVYV